MFTPNCVTNLVSAGLAIMLQHQPVNYPSLSLTLSYTLSLSFSHTLCLSLIHSLSLSFCQTDFTMREGHTHNIEFQTLQSSPSHFQSPPSVVLSLSLSHPRTQSPTHSFSFSNLLPVLNVVVVQMRI